MTTLMRVGRWWWILASLTAFWMAPVRAEETRCRIQLVWGTDDAKPPKEDIKPLDPTIRERLRQLRWKNYFVVKSETATVTAKERTKVVLSDRCAVDLKEVPGDLLEVRMHALKAGSEPKQIASRTLSLKELEEGKLIIYAGDSADRWDDAWLVIVGSAKVAAAK